MSGFLTYLDCGRSFRFASFLLAILITAPGFGQGLAWSRYGGNSQNSGVGVSSACTGVPLWFSNTGTNQFDSPVVGPDGTVYVWDAGSDLCALDQSSGSQKWTLNEPLYKVDGNSAMPPLVGPDGTLYINAQMLDTAGNVTASYFEAVNGATGAVVWSFQTATSGTTAPSVSGMSTPVMDANGTVYTVAGSDVYALNSATGALIWTCAVPPPAGAQTEGFTFTPCALALSPDGSTVYANGGDLVAVDTATGVLDWRYDDAWAGVWGPPAVGTDGTVYEITWDGVAGDGQEVAALDGHAGSVKWQTSGYNIMTPLAIGPDGRVYTSNAPPANPGEQYLVAFDGATGAQAWTINLVGGRVTSSPALLGSIGACSFEPNGTMFVSSEGSATGRSDLYAVDPSTNKILWYADLGNLNYSFYDAPAIAQNGNIYVGSDGVFAIGTTAINDIYASPSTVPGGSMTTLVVQLKEKAGPMGVHVQVYSSSTAVQATGSFSMNPGTTGASDGVWTSNVSSPTTAIIIATAGSVSQRTTVTVVPNKLLNFYVSPTTVVGGSIAHGVVQIQLPPLEWGTAIQVTSSSAAVEVDGAGVPAGKTGGSFTIKTSIVPSPVTAKLTATFGPYSLSANLTVIPGLAAISTSPSRIIGSQTTQGEVQLSGISPESQTVKLVSSSSLVSLPASVTIPAGSSDVSFPIETKPVSASTNVAINAEDGSSQQTVITLEPNKLGNFYVSPTSVIAGAGTRGVAQLQVAAAQGYNIVELKSGTAAVAVPSTVSVPAGTTGVSFPITTTSVTSTLSVRLTATFGHYSLNATLTVNPGLARIYASPAKVKGGVSTHGVVQLSGVSYVSQTIELSSSSGLVSLPTTVTIPAGSSGVSFAIGTKAVSSSETLTITAKEGSSIQQAALSLTP